MVDAVVDTIQNFVRDWKMMDFANPESVAIFLMGIIVIHSPLTSIKRIKLKKFCSPEDAPFAKDPQSHVGNPDSVDRIRASQRNAIENNYPLVFLILLAVKAKLSIAPICLAAVIIGRCGHSISYLAGLQPHRAICYLAGVFSGLYLTYQLTQTYSENSINRYLAILCGVMIGTGPVVGMLRKVVKAGHPVAEDRAFSSYTGKNVYSELLHRVQLENIFLGVPFICLIILTKRANMMGNYFLVTLVVRFIYARVAKLVFTAVKLPKIVTFLPTAFSYALLFQLITAWSVVQNPKKFDYNKKEHLMLLVLVKSVFILFYEKMSALLRGEFEPSDEQLVEPEKYYASEFHRLTMHIRNDAETLLPMVVLVTYFGVSSVPLKWLQIFVAGRMIHGFVYLLHVPQPFRGLSWGASLFTTIRYMISFYIKF